MKQGSRRASLGRKAHLFIIAAVLVSVLGTALLSYLSSANQIDTFYKSTTMSCAKTFSSLLDADFLSELRTVAESGEFQQIRDRAEEEENEALIRRSTTFTDIRPATRT